MKIHPCHWFDMKIYPTLILFQEPQVVEYMSIFEIWGDTCAWCFEYHGWLAHFTSHNQSNSELCIQYI